MGLFRFVGGALIGTVLAPVTGGASLAAVAIASGTAAHTVGKWMDEDKENEAKREGLKEGYQYGYQQGSNDTAVRLAEILQGNDDLRIGAFALALHVGSIDGELSDEELDYIIEQLGRPDSQFISDYARSKIAEIIDGSEWCNFSWICDEYLDNIDDNSLQALDDFVTDIINADGVFSQEEKIFIRNDWIPYLRGRGI